MDRTEWGRFLSRQKASGRLTPTQAAAASRFGGFTPQTPKNQQPLLPRSPQAPIRPTAPKFLPPVNVVPPGGFVPANRPAPPPNIPTFMPVAPPPNIPTFMPIAPPVYGPPVPTFVPNPGNMVPPGGFVQPSPIYGPAPVPLRSAMTPPPIFNPRLNNAPVPMAPPMMTPSYLYQTPPPVLNPKSQPPRQQNEDIPSVADGEFDPFTNTTTPPKTPEYDGMSDELYGYDISAGRNIDDFTIAKSQSLTRNYLSKQRVKYPEDELVATMTSQWQRVTQINQTMDTIQAALSSDHNAEYVEVIDFSEDGEFDIVHRYTRDEAIAKWELLRSERDQIMGVIGPDGWYREGTYNYNASLFKQLYPKNTFLSTVGNLAMEALDAPRKYIGRPVGGYWMYQIAKSSQDGGAPAIANAVLGGPLGVAVTAALYLIGDGDVEKGSQIVVDLYENGDENGNTGWEAVWESGMADAAEYAGWGGGGQAMWKMIVDLAFDPTSYLFGSGVAAKIAGAGGDVGRLAKVTRALGTAYEYADIAFNPLPIIVTPAKGAVRMVGRGIGHFGDSFVGRSAKLGAEVVLNAASRSGVVDAAGNRLYKVAIPVLTSDNQQSGYHLVNTVIGNDQSASTWTLVNDKGEVIYRNITAEEGRMVVARKLYGEGNGPLSPSEDALVKQQQEEVAQAFDDYRTTAMAENAARNAPNVADDAAENAQDAADGALDGVMDPPPTSAVPDRPALPESAAPAKPKPSVLPVNNTPYSPQGYTKEQLELLTAMANTPTMSSIGKDVPKFITKSNAAKTAVEQATVDQLTREVENINAARGRSGQAPMSKIEAQAYIDNNYQDRLAANQSIVKGRTPSASRGPLNGAQPIQGTEFWQNNGVFGFLGNNGVIRPSTLEHLNPDYYTTQMSKDADALVPGRKATRQRGDNPISVYVADVLEKTDPAAAQRYWRMLADSPVTAEHIRMMNLDNAARYEEAGRLMSEGFAANPRSVDLPIQQEVGKLIDDYTFRIEHERIFFEATGQVPPGWKMGRGKTNGRWLLGKEAKAANGRTIFVDSSGREIGVIHPAMDGATKSAIIKAEKERIMAAMEIAVFGDKSKRLRLVSKLQGQPDTDIVNAARRYLRVKLFDMGYSREQIDEILTNLDRLRAGRVEVGEMLDNNLGRNELKFMKQVVSASNGKITEKQARNVIELLRSVYGTNTDAWIGANIGDLIAAKDVGELIAKVQTSTGKIPGDILEQSFGFRMVPADDKSSIKIYGELLNNAGIPESRAANLTPEEEVAVFQQQAPQYMREAEDAAVAANPDMEAYLRTRFSDRADPATDVIVPIYDKGGNQIDQFIVPGGYDGTFSYYEEWIIQFQGIDPNRLPPDVFNNVYSKLFRGKALDAQQDRGVHGFMNVIMFSIFSPNTPLIDNQAMANILRFRNESDMRLFVETYDAVFSSPEYKKLVDDVNAAVKEYESTLPPVKERTKEQKAHLSSLKKPLNEQTKKWLDSYVRAKNPNAGPLFVPNKDGNLTWGGSTPGGKYDTYINLAEIVRKTLRNPSLWDRLPNETDAEFVMRISSFTKGMDVKTINFALMLSAVTEWSIPTMDVHMVRRTIRYMLVDWINNGMSKADRKGLLSLYGREIDGPITFGERGVLDPMIDDVSAYIAEGTDARKIGKYIGSVPQNGEGDVGPFAAYVNSVVPKEGPALPNIDKSFFTDVWSKSDKKINNANGKSIPAFIKKDINPALPESVRASLLPDPGSDVPLTPSGYDQAKVDEFARNLTSNKYTMYDGSSYEFFGRRFINSAPKDDRFTFGALQWMEWDLERRILEPHHAMSSVVDFIPSEFASTPNEVRFSRSSMIEHGYGTVPETKDKYAVTGGRNNMNPNPPNLPDGVRGSILIQDDGGMGAKGAVYLNKNQKAVIALFEDGDISTLIHELAHVMRSDLVDADLKKVEAAFGIVDGKWTIEAEERFARSVERYLFDGKAPVAALKNVYANFREWMRGIYSRASEIGVVQKGPMKDELDRIFSGGLEGSRRMDAAATRRSNRAGRAAAAATGTPAEVATKVGFDPAQLTPGSTPVTAEEFTQLTLSQRGPTPDIRTYIVDNPIDGGRAVIALLPDGRTVGSIKFRESSGRIVIGMAETRDEWKRMGIGTEMYRSLQSYAAETGQVYRPHNLTEYGVALNRALLENGIIAKPSEAEMASWVDDAVSEGVVDRDAAMRNLRALVDTNTPIEHDGTAHLYGDWEVINTRSPIFYQLYGTAEQAFNVYGDAASDVSGPFWAFRAIDPEDPNTSYVVDGTAIGEPEVEVSRYYLRSQSIDNVSKIAGARTHNYPSYRPGSEALADFKAGKPISDVDKQGILFGVQNGDLSLDGLTPERINELARMEPMLTGGESSGDRIVTFSSKNDIELIDDDAAKILYQDRGRPEYLNDGHRKIVEELVDRGMDDSAARITYALKTGAIDENTARYIGQIRTVKIPDGPKIETSIEQVITYTRMVTNNEQDAIKLAQDMLGIKVREQKGFAKIWGAVQSFRRDNMMFSPFRGFVGALNDQLHDSYVTLVMSGPEAALRGWKGFIGETGNLTLLKWMPGMGKVSGMSKSVMEYNTDVVRKFGVEMPSVHMAQHGNRFGLDDSFMTVYQKIGHGAQVPGALFSSASLKRMRYVMDDIRRTTMFAAEFTKASRNSYGLLDQQVREFAERIGMTRDEASKVLADAWIKNGNAISPSELIRLFPGNWSDEGHPLARFWRGQVNDARAKANSIVDQSFFSYKYTRADQALSKAFMFHYWTTRSYALHARMAYEHPAILNFYARMWQAMDRQAKENEGKYPSWMRYYTTFMAGPFGLLGLANPFMILAPLVVAADIDNASEEKSLIGKVLTLLPPMHPIIDAAANMLGLQYPTDVTGTIQSRNALDAALHFFLGKAGIYDTDAYTKKVDDLQNALYEMVNEYLSSNLSLVPRQTTYPVQDRNQRDILWYLMQIADEQDMERDSLYPIVNEIITNQITSPLAIEAYNRWSTNGAVSAVLKATLPVTTTSGYQQEQTYLAGTGNDRMTGPDGKPRTSDDTGFDGLTPDQQDAIDNRSMVNTGSEAANELSQAVSAYAQIGGSEQHAYEGYNVIRYSNDPKELRSWVGSPGWLWYTPEDGGPRIRVSVTDIRFMSDDERERLADQWANGAGLMEEVKGVQKQKKTFRQNNETYAAYYDWRVGMRDYEGGPRAYAEKLVEASPTYRAWYEANITDEFLEQNKYTPWVIEQRLMSQDSYLASKGERSSIGQPDDQFEGDRFDTGNIDPNTYILNNDPKSGDPAKKRPEPEKPKKNDLSTVVATTFAEGGSFVRESGPEVSDSGNGPATMDAVDENGVTQSGVVIPPQIPGGTDWWQRREWLSKDYTEYEIGMENWIDLVTARFGSDVNYYEMDPATQDAIEQQMEREGNKMPYPKKNLRGFLEWIESGAADGFKTMSDAMDYYILMMAQDESRLLGASPAQTQTSPDAGNP